MSCELCEPKRDTEWIDKLPAGFDFNVFRCRAHNEFMIVSKHHGDWEPHEWILVAMLRDILFPGKEIRWEQQSIRDHPHVHIVGT
ncbi:hypothetical protein LCGC14_0262990 [marine sediment metagenome]|uniref:Uncharacterized protein n=1 Tax=marine sediment metagenome TaxID=412755 RepID=A0A0F9U1B1_9ZZZZ